jgi:hypothetical protein
MISDETVRSFPRRFAESSDANKCEVPGFVCWRLGGRNEIVGQITTSGNRICSMTGQVAGHLNAVITGAGAERTIVEQYATPTQNTLANAHA